MGAPLSFWDFGAPQCPPPPTQTPQELTILMTERGGAIILWVFKNIQLLTSWQFFYNLFLVGEGGGGGAKIRNKDFGFLLKYFNDRERGAIIHCRILAPLNATPSPDATIIITILITERGAPLSFWDFGAPQCPPPPTQTPQYLTILMTERGGAIILWVFKNIQLLTSWQFFLNLFLVGEGGGGGVKIQNKDFGFLLKYFNDRERGAIIYCRILAPLNALFTRRHNNYNYLNNREGAPLSFLDFGAPQCPPPLPRRHNT